MSTSAPKSNANGHDRETKQQPTRYCYPACDATIAHIAERYQGQLEITPSEQFTRVRVLGPETEVLICTFEPPRWQLVKELRRVAALYHQLADHLTDDDYTEAECDWTSAEEEWWSVINSARTPWNVTTFAKVRA